MEQVAPEVELEIQVAISTLVSSNLHWARAAEANEAAKGRWQVTVRCLEAAGLTSADFRLEAGSSPSVEDAWKSGRLPVNPRFRNHIFKNLWRKVKLQRYQIEENFLTKIKPPDTQTPALQEP